jgi:hypothetical protein
MDGGAEVIEGAAEVIEGAGRGWVDVEEEPLVAECVGRAEAVGDTGESKPDDTVVPLLSFGIRD